MLYITKPGGALLPSSGCDGSQGPPPAAAPPPIIQCNRQAKNKIKKATLKITNETIACNKKNKIVQCNRQKKKRKKATVKKGVRNNKVHQRQQSITV